MLISVFSTLLLLLHPFYVSITSVDYNDAAQRVEVSSRIFYDDLEVALKNGRDLKIDLINPENRSMIDSLLAAYFHSHLGLTVNGTVAPLHYVGYEIDEDVAWCFLEATAIEQVERLQINNQLLFDHFPNQSNIMHITVNGKRQSTKLDNPDHIAAFEW